MIKHNNSVGLLGNKHLPSSQLGLEALLPNYNQKKNQKNTTSKTAIQEKD